jgi:NADH:ubiquinone oxidoreductase subunit 4 (subunit M)
VTALIIQAAGGAMASIADTHEGANQGGNVMLAGIIIQLGTLSLSPYALPFAY